MQKTLLINRRECEQLLTLRDCTRAMGDVLQAIAEEQVKMLPRGMIAHEGGNLLAVMPASLLPKKVTGGKMAIFPGPAARETCQSIIPLFDTETGALRAIVDAECITVRRTAATSAAATQILARDGAASLAVLGTGRQGKMHVMAIAVVKELECVYLWDAVPAAAQAAAEELRQSLQAELPYCKVIVCQTAQEAVENADIVCTTTSGKSAEPVLRGAWLKEGAHVNCVGACSAETREVDAETLRRARVYTDSKPAALQDAGDLLIPMRAGELDESIIRGDVGAVRNFAVQGRVSQHDITLFESVGLAVEDIAAAWLVYEKALAQGMGTEVEI